ncbi:MAG TPA: electron transfer flavoprotein subunit alpha/FixB family protein [Clostridiaceae bacterium]|nr:electron transfer flavoprotein subunit alpha/FixB family protein [Clostridiaceae bacterium]
MNIHDYKDLYVLIEHEQGILHDASIELLGEAKRLKEDRPGLQYQVVAVILGTASQAMLHELGQRGADEILYLKNEALNTFSTERHTQVLYEAIVERKPDIFLIPATVLGRDLAPRLAARCDTGLTADATKLAFDPDHEDSSLLLVTRPAFGGNLFGTIINEDKRPQMTTIRPGVMDKWPKQEEHRCTITEKAVSLDHIPHEVHILEVLEKDHMAVDIAKAEIIISGGRGVGNGFHVLRTCAEMLGAEVAGSRAAVDEGRIDKAYQVGQTGKTVKPKVYIACGISGAVQHLAGMEKSDYIIAINKDPNAPIFQSANIGLVGDALEILPLLTEEIRNYRERPS